MPHLLQKMRRQRIKRLCSAKPRTGGAPASHRIARIHDSASVPRDEHQEHANGPLPGYKYRLAGGYARFADRFEARVHGLDKRGFLKGYVYG